ncbi:T9SS C-terminal target domain-containing protein, partial [bacterium]|nr:T9SS C-terminal target domain-containing protein [bacterium]
LATCIGKRVVLYGAAVGDTAFTYQWLKNGLPIAGANKDSLVFSSVTAVDDAYYTLACIMPCGTFVSNVVKVTVQGLPDAPIVNKTVVYCQNDSAKPLVATGNIIRWYTDTILGTGSYIPPTHNTSIPGTTTYYVTNSNILTCESPRYPVVVTVLQGPTISANVGDSVSLVPNQFATIKVTASANTVDVKWFYNGLYMGLTPGNSIVVDRSKLGKYYAEATTIDGCKARTQTISVKANTGFGSSATGNNLTIYPNPSKSLVNVFFDNPVNTNGTLRVVDVLGQVMQTMPVKFTNKNQLMQINVANLAAGIYTIEILNKYNETIARNQLIKTN